LSERGNLHAAFVPVIFNGARLLSGWLHIVTSSRELERHSIHTRAVIPLVHEPCDMEVGAKPCNHNTDHNKHLFL